MIINNVVCYGNSLTYGSGVAGLQAYPMRFQNYVDPSQYVTKVWPKGTPGAQTPWLITNLAAQTAGVFDPTAQRNIMFFWEASNHIALGLATAEQAIQLLIDASVAIKAAGWEVLIGTVTMRSCFAEALPVDEGQNRILAVNLWLRANWHLHFDGIIDFARASYLGDATLFETKFTTVNGPPPYGDCVHFTATGYDVMGQKAYADYSDFLDGGQEHPIPPATTLTLKGTGGITYPFHIKTT